MAPAKVGREPAHADSDMADQSRAHKRTGAKDAQLLSMRLHVKYIRSLEDSDRVRPACIRYLQNWLIYFNPERPDSMRELESLAVSLGGQLEIPRLRWKYAWIEPLPGPSVAENAQMLLPQLKASLFRAIRTRRH